MLVLVLSSPSLSFKVRRCLHRKLPILNLPALAWTSQLMLDEHKISCSIPVLLSTSHKCRQIAEVDPFKHQQCRKPLLTGEYTQQHPKYQPTTVDLSRGGWSGIARFLYLGNNDGENEDCGLSRGAEPWALRWICQGAMVYLVFYQQAEGRQRIYMYHIRKPLHRGEPPQWCNIFSAGQCLHLLGPMVQSAIKSIFPCTWTQTVSNC